MDEKELFLRSKEKVQIEHLYDKVTTFEQKLKTITDSEEFKKLQKEFNEFKDLTQKRLSNLEKWISERGVKLEYVMALILKEMKELGKLPEGIAQASAGEAYPEEQDEEGETQEVIDHGVS